MLHVGRFAPPEASKEYPDSYARSTHLVNKFTSSCAFGAELSSLSHTDRNKIPHHNHIKRYPTFRGQET